MRNAAEIGPCRPWLETEIALVKPRVLVCLGATAAQTLLGKGSRSRDEARREELRRFVADLKKVAARVSGTGE